MLARSLFCFRERTEQARTRVRSPRRYRNLCPRLRSRHYYDNNYWPDKIETSRVDEDILCWLEEHICMKLMFPRRPGTLVVKGCNLNEENVKALADAASRCWDAIMRKDLDGFAAAFKASFEVKSSCSRECWQMVSRKRSPSIKIGFWPGKCPGPGVEVTWRWCAKNRWRIRYV